MLPRSIRRALLSSGVLAASVAPLVHAVEPPKPFGAVPSERQMKWHDTEMNAFVHFTVDTFTNKEWGYGDENPSVFNPTQFDADQIVGTLAKAGFKGVIVTGKHHDGFCLWPTKTTTHNISASPYKDGKGDIVGEFSAACKKHGVKFGVYLSPWDRNSPLYGRPEYVTDVYRRQLTELLTNYGDIFEVWFDGANGGDGYYGGAREKRTIDRKTYYGWPETILNIVRKLQPNAVIFGDVGPDVRWAGNESGFVNETCWSSFTPKYRDTKQPVPIDPATGFFKDVPTGDSVYEENPTGHRDGQYWIPPECDVSIRPGWFWHESQNSKVRSPANLMDLYLRSVGHGGSFLLNAPPDNRGILHENDVASLSAFGEHLRQTFATNLAAGASVTASNTRGNDATYSADKLIDSDKWSAWITDDAELSPTVEIALKGEQTFNIIKLREDIRLGHRVDALAIDAMVDGHWKEIAKGESIGACRMWRVPRTTTSKVRLRVTKASACPAMSDFGLFLEPPAPAWSASEEGRAKLAQRKNWKVLTSFDNPESSSSQAIDGDPKTFWHTATRKGGSGLPTWIAIDLGNSKTIAGITYLTRQDHGSTNGIIDKYQVDTSDDGQTWTKVAEGEFANIQANPIEQTVTFDKPAQARFVRLTALHVISGDHIAVAEFGVIEK